jgi:hypothetical protein
MFHNWGSSFHYCHIISLLTLGFNFLLFVGLALITIETFSVNFLKSRQFDAKKELHRLFEWSPALFPECYRQFF